MSVPGATPTLPVFIVVKTPLNETAVPACTAKAEHTPRGMAIDCIVGLEDGCAEGCEVGWDDGCDGTRVGENDGSWDGDKVGVWPLHPERWKLTNRKHIVDITFLILFFHDKVLLISQWFMESDFVRVNGQWFLRTIWEINQNLKSSSSTAFPATSAIQCICKLFDAFVWRGLKRNVLWTKQ